MAIVTIDELRSAGLLDQMESPHLTIKGRDWLRVLEDVETQEVTDLSESAADFVLSTNGLFR
jgi:hypothetical protein